MLKPGVDEDELEAEQQPRDEPGPKRPVARESAMPRSRAQASRSSTAAMERSAACMTSDTSAAIALTVTCWNPHSAVSRTITAYAFASSAFLS